MMGGKIEVQSILGEGSTFSFTMAFPRQEKNQIEEPSSVQISSQAVYTGPPLRLLVAEDNVVNQRVLAHFLRKLGHAAEFVNGGMDCLERISQESFDLVLMDVQMPDLDGMETTRRIRALPGREKNFPYIIAITADAMPEDRRKCIDAGMNDYVSKPVREEALRQTFAKFIQLRETSGE